MSDPLSPALAPVAKPATGAKPKPKKPTQQPVEGDTFAASLGHKVDSCIKLIPHPGDEKKVIAMKNLLFAPWHKSYQAAPTSGHELGSFMNEKEGKWYFLSVLCRDSTKFRRPVVPFLRVDDNSKTARLVFVVYGNSPLQSIKKSIMYNLEDGYGEALAANINRVLPGDLGWCEPNRVDYQVRYVFECMHLQGLQIAHPESLEEKVASSKDYTKRGTSLLVLDGLMPLETMILKKPIELQDRTYGWGDHGGGLCDEVETAEQSDLALVDTLAKNRWPEPAPDPPHAPALAPGPEASCKKRAADNSDDESSDDERPKKKKNRKKVDSDNSEDELSDSGSDSGSESEDDEEEDSSAEDSEASADESEEEDTEKKEASKRKPSAKTARKQAASTPANPSNGEFEREPSPPVASRSRPCNEGSVDRKEPSSKTSEGKVKGEKKRKPAYNRRAVMAITIRGHLDNGKALYDSLPVGQWERLNAKMDEASKSLKDYVDIGKKEEEQAHIIASWALIGECFACMSKMRTQVGSQAPEAHASRRVAHAMAKLYEKDQPEFEKLSSILTEMASTLGEMTSTRARFVQEAEQAASQLPFARAN